MCTNDLISQNPVLDSQRKGVWCEFCPLTDFGEFEIFDLGWKQHPQQSASRGLFWPDLELLVRLDWNFWPTAYLVSHLGCLHMSVGPTPWNQILHIYVCAKFAQICNLNFVVVQLFSFFEIKFKSMFMFMMKMLSSRDRFKSSAFEGSLQLGLRI